MLHNTSRLCIEVNGAVPWQMNFLLGPGSVAESWVQTMHQALATRVDLPPQTALNA